MLRPTADVWTMPGPGESPAHPDPPAPFAHMHKKQELAVNNLSIEIYIGDIFFSYMGQHCKSSYSKNELCLLSSWTFHALSPTKCFFSFSFALSWLLRVVSSIVPMCASHDVPAPLLHHNHLSFILLGSFILACSFAFITAGQIA